MVLGYDTMLTLAVFQAIVVIIALFMLPWIKHKQQTDWRKK